MGQDITGQKMIIDNFTQLQGDYVGIMTNPSALIPPIFMMDEHGRCLEWNDAMQKLSGLKREEAIDQILVGEVFTVSHFGCQVKDQNTLTKLQIVLNRVLAGEEGDKFLFGLFDHHGEYVETLLSANRRIAADGRISGVLCFLHVASPELQYAMKVQKISEQADANTISKLAYIRREINNPMNGIKFVNSLMKSSHLSKEQRQLLRINKLCLDQLAKVVDDTDIDGIEEWYDFI